MFFLNATATLITLLTSLFFLYWYRLRKRHYWSSKPILSDVPKPILGSMGGMFRGELLYKIEQGLYQKYGKLFGAYAGPSPFIYVAEPDLLKNILVKDFHCFADRKLIQTGSKYFDNGIGVVNGEQWKKLRTIISPTFSTGKIKAMMLNVEKCAQKTTENALRSADGNKSFDVKKLLGSFSLDVVANVAFGTELDSHNDENNRFVTMARKVFNRDISWRTLLFMMAPKLAIFLGISCFDTGVMDFFKDLTVDIILKRKGSQKERKDFLQLLLECYDGLPEESEKTNGTQTPVSNGTSETNGEAKANGIGEKAVTEKTLNLVEIISQCIMFFFAGHDPTGITLSMVLYNLALNPEVRKLVHEEVDKVFEESNAVEGAFSTEQTRYLDAVISETLRLCPPSPSLVRSAKNDYPLGDTGIVIPKGMTVIVPVYAMHRDPSFFPEPEKFMPERFLPENQSRTDPFVYLPFGNGPRNCVARRFALVEIKLCLLVLMRQLEFHTCPETKIPLEYFNGSGFVQPKSVVLQAVRRDI